MALAGGEGWGQTPHQGPQERSPDLRHDVRLLPSELEESTLLLYVTELIVICYSSNGKLILSRARAPPGNCLLFTGTPGVPTRPVCDDLPLTPAVVVLG